ncbi:methyltransferase [bacterium]|nr:methyltransferase [candidate division CSSED10-310 bacterium]
MSEAIMPKSDEDIHEFLDGDLTILQKKRGCRVSQESVLLAGSVATLKGAAAVDLGTGCGILPLLLARTSSIPHFTGIEFQPELVDLARRNVRLNDYEERIEIVNEDIRRVQRSFEPAAFDLVIANPPFRRLHAGRYSSDSSRRDSLYEVQMELPDLVAAARYLLRYKGTAAVVYGVERLAELVSALQAGDLEPKYLVFIHHHRECRASAVIVHARLSAKPGLEVGPPITLNAS